MWSFQNKYMNKLILPNIRAFICNRKEAPNLNFMKMSSLANPIESAIKSKLSQELNVTHLDVINESYMHNVPKGAETHFKVVVVSEKFKDLPLIKRHRMVNDILKEELQNGVHALSIVAKTTEQWNSSDKNVDPSPNCRGGFGK